MLKRQKSTKLIFIYCLMLIIIFITQIQSSSSWISSYGYSTIVEAGDIISWEVERFSGPSSFNNFKNGIYVTNGVYLPEGSTLSVRVNYHPNDLYYKHPLLLWNTSTDWYDLYINDSKEILEITMSSLMTIGFLTLPYLAPVKAEVNEEEKNYFPYLIEQEEAYNHTSTGTLDETSEYPIDYVRKEIFTTFINSTDFSSKSIDNYKRTQVISENLTYIWTLRKEYNNTYDITTGILKKEECIISNVTTTIETDENSSSTSKSYHWFKYNFVSNYTYTSPQTDPTSFSSIIVISPTVLLCLVLFPKFLRKKGKNRRLDKGRVR
ncbi:MAG: hypothetical protein HGN29_07445 [Asgard group archaeon]|nr:hypothetical protein [Asgard group archaeon]